MSKELEEGNTLELDFSKLTSIAEKGIKAIVAIAQHVETHQVLITGYATKEALEHTLKTGKATFFSTSRNELWVKGATSGDYLEVKEVLVNCEQNSILYRVKPVGAGACHTKNSAGKSRQSCYYRRIHEQGLQFVER